MNDHSSTISFNALTQYFQRVEAVDVPHTGKSYLAHGIGVYRDLKAWGWAETAARAGLFHSIYGTEIFEGFTLPLSQRDEIRSMIGDHAESLCYLNCALKRRQFDTEVARGFGPYRIGDRFENTLIDLSDTVFLELCELHLCDWLEQVTRAKGWDYRRQGYRQIALQLGGTGLQKYRAIFDRAPEQAWFDGYLWPQSAKG